MKNNQNLINISHFFKYYLLLLFFLIGTTTTFSQELFAAHYSTQNQLTSNEVYDIIQDEDGAILFATDDGVYIFNGFEFKLLETPLPTTILHFEKDSKGKIWCYSTNGSIFFFNGTKIISFALNKEIQQQFNISSFPIDFQVKNDTIYFSDRGNGLLKIDRSGFKIHYSKDNYSNYSFKNKSYRLIKELNSEVLIFHLLPKVKIQDLHEKPNNLSFQYKNETIHLDEFLGRIPFFRQKNIKKNKWYFTIFKWVFKIENNTLKLITKLPEEALCLELHNEGILIGLNRKKGMVFLNPKTKKIQSHFLNGLTVTDILKDNDGSFWISTLESGVYHTNSFNSLIFFNNKDNVQSDVIDFYNIRDDEVLVLKTKNNLAILNADSLAYSTTLNSNTLLRWVNRIGNKVYVGGEFPCNVFEVINTTKKGSYQFLKKYYDRYCIPINDSTTAIKIFNKNHYNISNNKLEHALNNLSYKRFDYIYNANDTTYFVNSKGFFFQPYNESEISKLNVDTELLNLRVTAMLKVGSIYLIGSKSNGVYICDKSFKKISSLTNDETNIDLQKINDISKHKNLIFISSNKGISIYSFKKNDLKLVTIITHPDTKANWKVFKTIANDSILWAKTSKGLLLFKNYLSESVKASIKLHPTIFINDSSILFSKNKNIINAISGNQLTIEMNPTALNNHFPITYLYKFGNNEWTSTSTPFIHFNTLPPGKTKVLFKAKNNLYETPIHEFEIRINKNWYESILFQLIVGFVMVLITYLTTKKVITYRHKKRLKKEQEKIEQLSLKLKSLRAQMNPHFMFNALNSIMYFVLDNQQKQAAQYLSKFSKLVRLTLQFSEEQEISIYDEIHMISLYLDLEKVRLEDSFLYTINIDKALPIQKMYIPSMILQPILENSVWHGVMHLKDKKGLIEVNLDIQSDILNIEIVDNGIGRDASSKLKQASSFKRSMGMEISTKRIHLYEEIKGLKLKIKYIDLIDKNGKECGTKVILQLPIIYK